MKRYFWLLNLFLAQTAWAAPAFVGYYGFASNSSTSTSVTFQTTNNIVVGHTVVIIAGIADSAGTTGFSISCSDVAGNSYTTIAAQASNSANTGCTASTTPWPCCTGSGTGTCSTGIAVCAAYVATQITASSTNISVSYSGLSGTLTKGVILWDISGLVSGSVAVDVSNTGNFAFNVTAPSSANDPWLTSPSRTNANDFLVMASVIPDDKASSAAAGNSTCGATPQHPFPCCTSSGAGTCLTFTNPSTNAMRQTGLSVIGFYSVAGSTGSEPFISEWGGNYNTANIGVAFADTTGATSTPTNTPATTSTPTPTPNPTATNTPHHCNITADCGDETPLMVCPATPG